MDALAKSSPRSRRRRPTKEELCVLRLRLREDPVFFARAVLGLSPWRMQAEVLRAVASHPRVAVAGGQGVGKDHVAAAAMLWFLYTRTRAIVLSTAPTERQVRKLLWGELRRQWASARVALGGTLRETELVLAPGWYAYGYSTDDPDRFQGFHAPAMLVVVDEASGVPRSIHEAVDAVLTGANAHLLLIGNPTTPAGRFFEAFSDESFVRLRIPCTAHPNVVEGRDVIPGATTRQWVEHVRASYGEDSAYYVARVLAEFPTEDADALLQRDWIERAFALGSGARGAWSLGVDVARFGQDSTVIVVAEGGTVKEVSSARGRDLVATAADVADRAARRRVDPARVYVDDTGLGGGVTDILRSRGLAVRAVQFGANAEKRDRFANRRAEMFWNLRRLMESGAVALGPVAGSAEGRILREQLDRLRASYTDSGRLRVTGEPGLLAAPSTSPDHADALALALAGLAPPEDSAADGAAPETAQRRAGIWLGG